MDRGHTAEEKIKILYEDSLADIRDLTNRIEAIGAQVIGAANAAKEAQLINYERSEAQLEKFHTHLVESLNEIRNTQIRLMQTEGRQMLQQTLTDAAKLKGEIVVQVRDAVLTEIATERSRLTFLSQEFGPALQKYTTGIGVAVTSLEGATSEAKGQIMTANGRAAVMLGNAVDTKVSAMMLTLVGLAAGVGAGVAVVVGGLLLFVLK